MNAPDPLPSQSEKEVFFEALDRGTPEERAAFLDGACGKDLARRARVEALLANHFQQDAFMQKPAPGPGGTVRVTFAEEAPGAIIGRYKLLQKIGEGGCGVVYMAEQSEPVRRRVALKVIKSGMDTKDVIARFEAERQALALMDHPNIAKVLDAGATETGRPFFVMELVRGVKITEYCDQNNVSTHERLDLFTHVCRAVQHAHQKGIIHRDIKPSNILVTMHDGVPMPKVIDFGIAKATQGRLTDQTVFTAYEQFIGTPAYMSPEQAEMSAIDIDTRSDIYSLGVLLYELLTGQTPFDAKELVQAGVDEMRRTIREKEPARPSTRLSTMIDADLKAAAKHQQTDAPKLLHFVRGDLDWIVMKCLEKDRTRRYETATGLALDVERHLKNEPILARPPSRLYRFQKTARRNKMAFAAVTLILVVLVSATIISVSEAIRAKRAEKLAKDKAAESQAQTDFFMDVFRSPDPARNGRTVTVAETLDKAAKKLETDFSGRPEYQAAYESTLSGTYQALGLYREAVALKEKALDFCLKMRGPEDETYLIEAVALIDEYNDTGQFDKALKLAEPTLLACRKVFGPKNRYTFAVMASMAWANSETGRILDALKIEEELAPLSAKTVGAEDPFTLQAMNLLADSYYRLNRTQDALAMREQLFPAYRKVLGAEHPDTIRAMHNLAISYLQAHRKEEAVKLLEETLQLARKVFGPEHPDTLRFAVNLGEACRMTERYDEAIKLEQDALEISQRTPGADLPQRRLAMTGLSMAYYASGRREEGLKLQEELVELDHGEGDVHTKQDELNLGVDYNNIGRLSDAARIWQDASAGYLSARSSDDLNTLRPARYLAMVRHDLGHKEESLMLREEILKIDGKALGAEHSETLQARDDLALSYQEAGRIGEAIQLLEEAVRLRTKLEGPTNNETVGSVLALANCYHAVGRHKEADDLLEQAAQKNPRNLGVLAELAAWEAWRGNRAKYEDACRRALPATGETNTLENDDLAGKACCLWPSTNAAFLSQALACAHRVAKGTNDLWMIAWGQFDLGLAQFRNGQWDEAEQSLALGESAVAPLDCDSRGKIHGMAELIRALALSRAGQRDRAAEHLSQGEKEMPPQPTDPGKPHVEGKILNHDMLLWWMLDKDARATLSQSAAALTR